MTFSLFTPRFTYAGNGVTMAFAFPRGFFVATDLKVYLVDNTTKVATLQTLVTDYNVTGGGSGSLGGTVTFTSAPATGKTIVIYRDTDPSNDLTSGGAGNPTGPEEKQFDRSMMLVDELETRMSFMMFMPLTYTGTFNYQMPTPVAGQAIGFNSTGDGFVALSIATQWLSGGTAPAASLGNNGDMYLRTSNGDVYQKLAGVWTLVGNITGPAGAGSGDVTGPAGAVSGNVPTFNGATGKLLQDGGVALSALAPKASPAFTGVPTAPTAAPGANTTQLATTAFSAAAIAAVIGTASAAGDTLGELETLISAKAPTNSPAFTGTPTTVLLQIDDANFNLDLVGTNARVTGDTNDYYQYDRTGNEHEFIVGGTTQVFIGSGYAWFTATVNLGNDTNFHAAMVAASPRFTFDTGDYLWYDRTNNEYNWNISGSGTVRTFGQNYGYNYGKDYLFGGINLNTASAPSVIQDGDLWANTVNFLSRVNGQTAIKPTFQFMSLTANYTLANQTAAQKAFNVPANGAFNAKANVAYEFEGVIQLDSMSASSGSFGFALAGTATTSSVEYGTVGNKAALATAAAPQATENVGTTLPVANTAVVTATTNTVGWMRIKGIVRVTGAGTLVPQVSLGVAAAARVLTNSYFRFTPLGADTVTTQGDIA